VARARSHTSQGGTGLFAAGLRAYTRPVPVRVLVVEDEPSLRLLCRINLELEGYEVVEAATLADARAAIASQDLDLVLLDLHLGRESARPLLEEIHGRTPRVPVALVTGSAELHPTGEAVPDATLVKPYTIEGLLSTVRDLVTG
jgi:DNA-binding NtrC family response regulator